MKIKNLFEQKKTTKREFRWPYVIAEVGVNHECNMDIAKRIIDEACEAGADAVKFQTYKADKIASKHSPAYWDITKEPTLSQYELFKKYDRFWKKDFEVLKIYCEKAGIEFLSTPFDIESALFLNDLMDVFKISSSDITNKPFIEYICAFNKPIILSTGASYLFEIERAVSWIDSYDNPLALLHCVLNYPTEDHHANLGMILQLKKKFPDYLIGYSDHTLPNEMVVLEIANLLGAVILEKHFTYDKSLPGNDHYHAMDKNDLIMFKQKLKRNNKIIGSLEKYSLESEEPARQNARRSLVASRFIPKGNHIDIEDLTWKRPASGISPSQIDNVIGKQAAIDILEDTILQWQLFI